MTFKESPRAPWHVIGIGLMFAFVALSVWGVTIQMNARGDMTGCPLMNGMSSFCRMSAFEHMRGWQGLFTAVISSSTIAFLLFILSGLIVSRIPTTDIPRAPSKRFWRLREKTPHDHLSNYLFRILSAGILHPKIY